MAANSIPYFCTDRQKPVDFWVCLDPRPSSTNEAATAPARAFDGALLGVPLDLSLAEPPCLLLGLLGVSALALTAEAIRFLSPMPDKGKRDSGGGWSQKSDRPGAYHGGPVTQATYEHPPKTDPVEINSGDNTSGQQGQKDNCAGAASSTGTQWNSADCGWKDQGWQQKKNQQGQNKWASSSGKWGSNQQKGPDGSRGQSWKQSRSEKKADVKWGRLQGKRSLVEHFRASSFLKRIPNDCRPICFYSAGAKKGQVEFYIGGSGLEE